MEVMDCILTRRSVRKFVPNKPIPRDILTEIIKAAQYAPSAHNKQPWEFVVIEDKAFLTDLPKYQQWTSFAKDASAAIIVCGDTDNTFNNKEEDWDFADIDCSLAIQNMLLAIHAKGLGATFCASAPIPEIMSNLSNLLNLPPNIRPIAIVVVGYPKGEIKQPFTRFHEQKIHWDKW